MGEQEEKRIVVKVAYNYFESGKWDRALDEYKKLVAIDPMDFLVHNMMAEIHIRKGDRESAISEYGKAAQLLRATNNMEKAIHAYNRIIKLDPDNREAKAKVEEVIKARLVEIDNLVQRGSAKNAREICERLLDKMPDHQGVNAKLEEIDRRLNARSQGGESAPAPEAAPAKKDREEPPKNEEVVKNLFDLAAQYESEQLWDEAVESYITILRFQPDNETARSKLKGLHRQIVSQDKSQKVWSHIGADRQKSMEQDKRLAKEKSKSEVGSAATRMLDLAVKEGKGKKPKDLEKLGQEAEEKLRLAIQDRRDREKQHVVGTPPPPAPGTGEDDQNVQVLLTQAQMYIRQNLLVEAMRLAQNILELDPPNQDVRKILKQIYDRKNI